MPVHLARSSKPITCMRRTIQTPTEKEAYVVRRGSFVHYIDLGWNGVSSAHQVLRSILKTQHAKDMAGTNCAAYACIRRHATEKQFLMHAGMMGSWPSDAIPIRKTTISCIFLWQLRPRTQGKKLCFSLTYWRWTECLWSWFLKQATVSLALWGSKTVWPSTKVA